MSKHSLLLVDGDPRSLRVLEVSLKKAGFNVTTAVNGRDALEKVELAPPDLVIAETQLEELDGFGFCQKLKSNPAWADIPFVFLTAQTDVATKIRGLELGVDDYLTKPIYIKEIVARARLLLQKRQRARIEERRDGRTRFAGHLSDMPIVDLIQTVEISRKTGLIQFIGEGGKQAAIYFRDGKVIDAEAGPLQAEDAVYRLLTWNEGEFEVLFRTVRRRDAITMSPQALLMEGMRRLDEWGRLCEQLPPLETRFEIDARELASRLGEIQDEHNAILRLFDGRRSVLEVIDACDYGDLESLEVIARLYFEGVLVEATSDKPTMSGEWLVLTTPSEPAAPAVQTEAPGLLPEDGDDEESAEDTGGAEPARTISGEWTLEAETVESPVASGTGSGTGTGTGSGTGTGTGTGSGTGTGTGTGSGTGTGTGSGSGTDPETRSPRAPSSVPSLPRTLSPTRAPTAPAAAAIPSLPSLGAPPRTSLIQKAIDDSDAIAVGELERELARHESSPNVKLPAPAESQRSPSAETSAAAPSETATASAVTAEPESSTASAATPALPNAVLPDRAAGPAGRGRRGSQEPPLRRGRAPGLAEGHATLVTDPRPPVRAPTGSKRLRTERGDAAGPTADPLVDEPLPPNQRGARWPAIVIGVVVLLGVGYGIVRVSRSGARRAAVSALAHDASVDATGALRADPDAAAGPAVVTVDAAPAPLDAPAPPPAPIDAAAVDTSAPVDAAIATRPPIRPPATGGDTIDRRLDAARRALASDPQRALQLADEILAAQRSARALLVRADALLRLGRTGDALAAADAAIAMAPRSAQAWELKGRILVAAGRRAEARSALVRSLDLRPTGLAADAVRRIIDQL